MTRYLPVRHLVAPWRTAATMVVVLAVFGSVLTLTSVGVGAEEPPEGFTDGWPVGAEDVASGATTSSVSVAASSTPETRYFGRGAYGAIVNAATSTGSSCGISTHGLVGLMLAPVFKESSNATTPSTAPSPMTLSRYDEWTGNRTTSGSNADANFGLYAFRDPDTRFARSYWHPGIGIWQYDSAGLGSPFIASERMNAGVVGADVARIVGNGYCTAKANGDSDQEARFKAWRDWGYRCHACESAFRDLVLHQSGRPSSSQSGFQYLELVDGIQALGGARRRTCSINGGRLIPCWYVDPANAQGATWWTGTPNDGDPTVAPAPLSHPFYVFKSGGREHRHWLSEDSGYAVDISARRRLGHNARPRSSDSDSGLSWSKSSGLCDETVGRGRCDPIPPNGVRVRFSTVNGTNYRPQIGDFDGDGLSDVLWYAPGGTQDYVWWSTSGGGFRSTRVSVGGDYKPLIGDLDGNGADDVVWYNGSSSYVWRGSSARRFSSSAVSMPSNRTVFLADIGGEGRDDIVAYGPGSASDRILTWQGGGLSSRSVTVNGNFQPFVGDFDGRGGDDILWYAPGSAADYVWWTTSGGAMSSSRVGVTGTYEPIVGDFDGNGADDVMWYGVGSTPDYTWFGNSSRSFSSRYTPVGGAYEPVVADLANDGRDDIVWYAPGTATDYWWRYGSGRGHHSSVLRIRGSYVAGAGTFGSGRDGVFWYGPGSEADALWYG